MFPTLSKTFLRKLGDNGDLYVFFIPNKFKRDGIGFVGKKELNALNVPLLKKTLLYQLLWQHRNTQ